MASSNIAPMEDHGSKGSVVVLSLDNICNLLSGKKIRVKGADFGVVFMAAEDPREDVEPSEDLIEIAEELHDSVENEIEREDDDDEEEIEESEDDCEDETDEDE